MAPVALRLVGYLRRNRRFLRCCSRRADRPFGRISSLFGGLLWLYGPSALSRGAIAMDSFKILLKVEG